MGFRFRRSIKLFPGFRLNLSKKGIGTSLGFKGFHLSSGPTGQRATTSIPGTGISFVSQSHKSKSGGNPMRSQDNPSFIKPPKPPMSTKKKIIIWSSIGGFVLLSYIASLGTNPQTVVKSDATQELLQTLVSAQSTFTAAAAITPTMTSAPAETETLDPTIEPTAANAVVSLCPNGCTTQQTGCDVKGNISSGGDKIYHLPGTNNYDDTVITPEEGELWFCSAEEAVANGWRAPK